MFSCFSLKFTVVTKFSVYTYYIQTIACQNVQENAVAHRASQLPFRA